ncbi:unnamed protein product, partial [Pleuronectes platessa]
MFAQRTRKKDDEGPGRHLPSSLQTIPVSVSYNMRLSSSCSFTAASPEPTDGLIRILFEQKRQNENRSETHKFELSQSARSVRVGASPPATRASHRSTTHTCELDERNNSAVTHQRSRIDPRGWWRDSNPRSLETGFCWDRFSDLITCSQPQREKMPFHHVTAGLLYKGNYLSRSLSESDSDVMASISVEELDEIREAFKVLDRDGNGFISKQELGMAMRSLGHMPSEVELAIIMQRLDMDGDGQVDFNEFMTILGPKLLSSETREGFLGSTIDTIFWQVTGPSGVWWNEPGRSGSAGLWGQQVESRVDRDGTETGQRQRRDRDRTETETGQRRDRDTNAHEWTLVAPKTSSVFTVETQHHDVQMSFTGLDVKKEVQEEVCIYESRIFAVPGSGPFGGDGGGGAVRKQRSIKVLSIGFNEEENGFMWDLSIRGGQRR